MASEQALAFVQELGIEPDSLGGRWVYLFGEWVRTLRADVEESAKTVLATALDRYANEITRSEKKAMTSERIEAVAKTCAEALVETGKFGRDTYVKAFGLVEFVGEGESVDALRAQKVAGIAEALATFAREAPTQKRCIIGQRCEHHDYIHGYEAEELRNAIEEMIEHRQVGVAEGSVLV